MASKFSGAERATRVVSGVVVVCRSRQLGQTPSLINFQHADDVGSPRAASVVGAKTAAGEGACRKGGSVDVIEVGLQVGRLVFHPDGRRHAVAELGGVGQLVDTSNHAAAADETVEVVAWIVVPGSVERGDRLTHRETSKLDERMVHTEGATGGAAIRGVADATEATRLGS